MNEILAQVCEVTSEAVSQIPIGGTMRVKSVSRSPPILLPRTSTSTPRMGWQREDIELGL